MTDDCFDKARPFLMRCRILSVRRLAHAAATGIAAALVILAAPCVHAHAGLPASAPEQIKSAGEQIYRDGTLGSGMPLEATGASGARREGKDAACVKCHRPSGFGSREGRNSIPPITGRYLFHPRASKTTDLDLPYVENMRLNREPYTEETLARAIRDGLDSEGRPLNLLMPRFTLGDADMAALIGYLKDLDKRQSRGATKTVLHFATIITPDADPVKRRGMLSVLKQYFADKNTFPLGATPPLRTSRKWRFMVNRLWQLHVWQLNGPPATWESQLERHYAEEPVLAVISGLGGKTWAPVHAFCEHQAVPCLFPNVEAPPLGADRDFYSLYFSRGVELEAGVIADAILKPHEGKVAKTVVQVFRAGDSGEAGAKALASALEAKGIAVRSHVLPAGTHGRGPARALRGVAAGDTLVLWLRPADVAELGQPPRAADTVFLSGLMAGLERAPLPQDWRSRTHIAYPFALPEQRRINVDYAFGWFALRNVPVVAEQVQADTFLACVLLGETLKHVVDNFVPEYLIERLEDMLERQVITGYYPRLSLAQGQRFASKGAYLAHFIEPEGTKVAADGNWVVP